MRPLGSNSMHPGDVVCDRFEIVALAGEGGMGSVYRARDRESGRDVALKVVRGKSTSLARFRREAEVLRRVEHDAVVRFVDAGETAVGRPYLAMEWLEGVPLSQRLDGTPVDPAEVVAFARAVAGGLATAHERGIVHRDLKPENILLVGGSLAKPKILDFGVALLRDGSPRMTRAGIPLGTIGYMSPEQARADHRLDARSDVFSLGCVLHECLTGRPTFWAEHALSILTRLVLEDPPSPKEVRPTVPADLSDLVMWMLAKAPEDRPADARAVLTALASLRPVRPSLPPPAPTAALGERERQVLSIVVVAPPMEATADATMSFEELQAELERVVRSAPGHSARFEALATGAIVAVATARGSATEQAMTAARLALALRTALPKRAIALCTGAGQLAGRIPLGDIMERAASLLESPSDLPGVAIDEVSAGLLAQRFELQGTSTGQRLLRERDADAGQRMLLGRATRCVGRDRELVTLEALYDECASEPVARIAIVTGDAGIGKSRLRLELCERVARRCPAPRIFLGRADPMRAGAPFAILADAIRNGLGLVELAPDLARATLLDRLSSRLGAEHGRRVSEFLGELAGVPFDDSDSVMLREARRDAMLMADQVRNAFASWLEGECDDAPCLVVLEDLHWGDGSTVRLLEMALARLVDRPLMVVAFARPDVSEAFPGLWQGLDPTELRLRGLSKRAAIDLVQQALGSIDPNEAERLVARAAGNAFFLEELVRAHAAGRRGEAPGTVVAMVQTRLEEMDAPLRRALRAASVFGTSFWESGVSALLGDPTLDVTPLLERLSQLEVVAPRTESHFAGERELTFRHALTRDAAYGTLTSTDRQIGHRAAARWLAPRDGVDPALLAEHHQLGDEAELAAPYWLRAATRALEASDFHTALERAERGTQGATDDTLRGLLAVVELEALRWLGHLERAEVALDRALSLLTPEGPRFWDAAAEGALLYQRLGKAAELAAHGKRLRAALHEAHHGDEATYALVRTALSLQLTGDAQGAASLFQVAAVEPTHSPRTHAYAHLLTAIRALHASDLGTYLKEERLTLRYFEAAGDERRALNERGSLGYAYLELGAYDDARSTLETALERSRQLGLDHMVAASQHNLGLVLARLGEFESAERMQRDALATFVTQRDRRLEGAARAYLAQILLLAGRVDDAEREGLRALEVVTEVAPPIRPQVLATLARAALSRGDATSALARATDALNEVESSGGAESGDADVRLAAALVLGAVGQSERARTVLGEAVQRLFQRAATIDDPTLRDSFRTRVPENAATLDLARKWGLRAASEGRADGRDKPSNFE